MSDPSVEPRSAGTLIARAAAADARVRLGLAGAIEDFFVPDGTRLDDRTRTALRALLHALVDTIEREIRADTGRWLADRNAPALADAIAGKPEPVAFARLWRAGLLRDSELMADLIARVRQDRITQAAPPRGPDEPQRPSVITRCSQHPDRLIAGSAMAVLVAESRRRAMAETGAMTQTDLPAELHHRLVWWVAACLREIHVEQAGAAVGMLDRALTHAAQRSLTAHDEGERLESASMRLAVAIDARPAELVDLMLETLGDRRIALFTALLAHALRIGYDAARDILFDSEADRLWLALRALDLERDAIAHVCLALYEADPRRDIEAFAEAIDAIVSIDPGVARVALARLRLPVDYQAALHALGKRP